MAPTSRSAEWIAEEFDRRATSYDESAMHRWQAEHAVDLLNAHPGGRILDIATGTGLGIRAVTSLGPSPYLVGIDVSEQMLRVAVRETDGQRCSYARSDAHRLPFQANTFDGILCVAAVSYFHDLPRVIQECRRVSQPAATLVFTTPAADGLTVNRLVRRAAANHGVTLPDPHAALGSEAAIEAFARPLGLTIDQVARHDFADQLDATPRASFNAVIDYGYAEALTHLSGQRRECIFEDYRQEHLNAALHGEGGQDWLFTRCLL